MRKTYEGFKQLFIVSSPDPEEARVRNLLNIILAASFTGEVTTVLILGIGILVKRWSVAQASFLLVFMGIAFLLTMALFLANRRPGRLAVYLFIILCIIGTIFSDTPANISNGSSVLFFAFPIVVASLLIRPSAGFFVAVICCGIITWANGVAFPGSTPNFVVMISFFLLSLMAWLATHSLQDSMRKLHQSNENLDQLVQERTKDLTAALERQRIETGQTKAILESIADGVLVFDDKGYVAIANPGASSLLDLPHDKIIGSTFASLAGSEALDDRNRLLLSSLLKNPGEPLKVKHIDWGKKTLSVTSAPVHDALGASIGTVAVFRDYTLEAENERIRNSLVAIVSHELRTPLNVVEGYAEMLKNGQCGPMTENEVQAASRIQTNTLRLQTIVNDLLDETLMQAGRLSLHCSPFRPSDLIENVCTVIEKIAADKGLVLTSHLDPHLPELINGDIARLEQILINLGNNAIKFTHSGSIHISLSLSNEKSWSLEVLDSGIGIPENELSTIFEPFRQVNGTTLPKYGGVGLGLSIVKQLTELMGGRVDVKSELGKGSNFIVTLPLE